MLFTWFEDLNNNINNPKTQSRSVFLRSQKARKEKMTHADMVRVAKMGLSQKEILSEFTNF